MRHDLKEELGVQWVAGSILPKHFPSLPAGFTVEAHSLHSYCGKVRLFAQEWKAPAIPKVQPTGRALLILHGFWEHGGRYLHVPHYIEQSIPKSFERYFVLDHRGHGRSEGTRGHIDDFDEYVADAAKTYHFLKERLLRESGRAEIHLLGHSMGGLISLRLLSQHPELEFVSATLSAPALGLKVKPPVVKKVAAKILNHVWSALQLEGEFNPTLLSHDPEVARAYQADRLTHTKVTPGFFSEFEKKMADSLNNPGVTKVPTLWLLAGHDGVVDTEKALKSFEVFESSNKKKVLFPELFHELLNESEKDKVFFELSAWLKQHIG